MLDICLLGTGGMMPLPNRWLTSLITRCNGRSVLIDCGEGTQISMRQNGWNFKPIEVICFTHYPGDHISGLPGILLAMANADRTEPLTLVGPKGLSRVVSGLRVIAPELPFEIRLIELTETEQCLELHGFRITAFRVRHNIVCYGYTLEILRGGKFDPVRAREQGIPLQYWNPLQKGETIVLDDRVLTPDMVLGPQRRGLKVTYVTDTRPTESISAHARGADLFVCEGMYGDPDKRQNAKENRHMMMQEAARLAAEAQPQRLWLTHFSPSMAKPKQYLSELQEIFPQTRLGKDGKALTLQFADES